MNKLCAKCIGVDQDPFQDSLCSKCDGKGSNFALMKGRIFPNEYQTNALQYEAEAYRGTLEGINTNRLIQGLLGLTGEAGECADLVKKAMFQGHEFDKNELILELGDVLYYICLCARAVGSDLEIVMKKNLEKLNDRYPNRKFEVARSINRKEYE